MPQATAHSDVWILNLQDDETRRAVTGVGEILSRVPGRVGVAFSGGVDSAVLLALAVQTLGRDRVVGIMGVSPSLATIERDSARLVAEHIGVPLLEISTEEGKRGAYVANGPDRCFHCRDELFTRIGDAVVAAHSLSAVAYGENADDVLRADRPGARAASQHAVLRPLSEAGMTKRSVRDVARAMGLPCAEKPAAPCLASRIPHFTEVTPEKLAQVEAAESALRDLGFTDSRVRHHGEVARIELPTAELPRAVAEECREEIARRLRVAGFRFVALDLAGIQSGAFTLPLVSVGHRGGRTHG